MEWKAWSAIALAMMVLTPAARAGYVLPTWVETVEVVATLDPDTGQLVTSFYQLSASITGFSLYYNENRYSGEYTSYETLIDYQNVTGPITVDLTLASVGGYLSGYTVPLSVSAFPASPQPPVLDYAPQGDIGSSIPAGDYSSSPLSVLLSPDAHGSVCFLLSTGTTDIFNPGPSVIDFQTVTAMAMAPEPSPITMLAPGIGFVLACLGRRQGKRPGRLVLAGR